MKNGKQQYIHQIRANTAYPVYRRFAGILMTLGYVVSGFLVLIALLGLVEDVNMGHFREGFAFFIGSLIAAVIIVFASRLLREAALIFADIADSITDSNSKPIYG